MNKKGIDNKKLKSIIDALKEMYEKVYFEYIFEEDVPNLTEFANLLNVPTDTVFDGLSNLLKRFLDNSNKLKLLEHFFKNNTSRMLEGYAQESGCISNEKIEKIQEIFQKYNGNVSLEKIVENNPELENQLVELYDTYQERMLIVVLMTPRYMDESSMLKVLEGYFKTGTTSVLESYANKSECISAKSLQRIQLIFQNNENISLEEVVKDEPELKEQLIKLYGGVRDINQFEALVRLLGNSQVRHIISEVVAEKSSQEEIDDVIEQMLLDYVESKKDDLVPEQINAYLNGNVRKNLFSSNQIGITEYDQKMLGLILSIIDSSKIDDEPLEEMMNMLLNKLEIDCAKINGSKSIEEFVKLDQYFGKAVQIASKANFYDADNPLDNQFFKTINILLDGAKDISLEEIANFRSFDDYTFLFAENIANKENILENPENTKLFKGICGIFETFLRKCDRPEDLLNSTISKIMGLMHTEYLPQEYRDKLNNIYQVNYRERFAERDNGRINEIKENYPQLLEKVNNKEALSDNECKILEELACLERTVDGNFKDEYIDSILRYYLDKDIHTCVNTDLLKRIIEAQTLRIHRENGIRDYIVCTMDKSYFSSESTMADHDGRHKIIRFNEKCFNESTIIELIGFAHHESQHAVQHNFFHEIENGNGASFDFLSYDMYKDVFLNSEFGNAYYRDNYLAVMFEIDARIAEEVRKIEYLQSIGLDDKKVVDIIQELDIEKRILEDSRMRNKSQRLFENKEGYNDSKMLDELFQETIEANPEMIKRWKFLQIEFDAEKCKRKGNIRILEEYNSWCAKKGLDENQVVINEYSRDDEATSFFRRDNKTEDRRIAELYAHIINGDGKPSDEEMINDLRILPSLDLKYSKLDELRDTIIKKDILPRFDEWINSHKVHANIEPQFLQLLLDRIRDYAGTLSDKELAEEIVDKIDKLKGIELGIIQEKNGAEEIGDSKPFIDEIASREKESPNIVFGETKKEKIDTKKDIDRDAEK